MKYLIFIEHVIFTQQIICKVASEIVHNAFLERFLLSAQWLCVILQLQLLDTSQQVFTCSKLTIETLEQVNSEHISHLVLVLLLLTLKM